MPARSSVTSPAGPTNSGDTYFTDDLFGLFNSYCGACHVNGSFTPLTVSRATFTQLITQAAVDRITSDDPAKYMPPAGPTGKPYSQRDPADPVVQMVALLQTWLKQGSPNGSFTVTSAASGGNAGAAGGASTGAGGAGGSPTGVDYSVTPELGGQLTNIGSCVPAPKIIAVNQQTMDQLDATFAVESTLPNTLAATDLVSLDSDTLARNGVISYAPAYPLWSDNAMKMRYVRVPRGESITFDKNTQQFTIPANTRFYKTFLKKVIDATGNVAYRKIETRIIVSRPDTTLPDGTVQQNALYGTYVWNDAETEAALLQVPLNDGTPFADRLVKYITDEPKAQAIIDSNPPNVDYALEIENPGLVRHYALPGSHRCVQCHMGSPSASFVLGFTPLQVSRPAEGTSGVIEPPAGDELTQLQRLIDYGVVSGMTSPADVIPLEQTQLPRTPRPDVDPVDGHNFELTAQAYLVGNCSHCHNPRGFPSTKAPVLKDVLNFLPGPNGGIFQFPLDRFSPVRTRGAEQDVQIPYITPSLRDYPVSSGRSNTYRPKYLECTDGAYSGWCTAPGQKVDFIDAPWRSLIYRNVDTPFDYADDYSIFPHMPMNTSGYDCRVTQILGDWMVSIPSTLVNSSANQDADPTVSPGDTSFQPYVEVTPDNPNYASAQADAAKRLAQYHAGHRYNFCPDTTDIVDPVVEYATPADQSKLGASLVPDHAIYTADQSTLVMIEDGVPDQPHWVSTDDTELPGDWEPRRSDWATALVMDKAVNSTTDSPQQIADLQTVVDDLQDITVAGVKDYLTAKAPMGLWATKDKLTGAAKSCNFAGQRTAASFTGDQRPMWMDNSGQPVDPNAAVYQQTPGEAVFSMVCVNCHGPQADSKGLLADEVSLMTGGSARVANFRDGLLGPVSAPGQNRQKVFGPATAAPSTATVDDFAARYVPWMALGGTQKYIPTALLNIVLTTPVLGVQRQHAGTLPTANMLELAQELCSAFLPANAFVRNLALFDSTYFKKHGRPDWQAATPLIAENGDAELWMGLCTLNNTPIIRVVHADSWKVENPSVVIDANYLYRYSSSANNYPATAPVLDHRGRLVNGITSDNLLPMCVQKPTDPGEAAAADQFLQANPVGAAGSVIPYCPPDLFPASSPLTYRLDPGPDPVKPTFPDANKWAIRGAINAGVAVFLYLDQVERGMTPQPAFDHCEQLSPPAMP